MNLHVKFRVRLTIGVVVPVKPQPGGVVDVSLAEGKETVEHVCAYECDVIVNRFECYRSPFWFWRKSFEHATRALLEKAYVGIGSRIRP